ncbi:MAG: BAX inhibitor protein [endosymbiont of Galathealinum brachiosum]|uniref:BAX inhibitor protein n=1 Tax=endosymbiont of Galathealinum brachiosum TaxID=2200906 RepID=A0A370DIE1_9GAMM|nr:MAG: BAX inhibitor protein [endosymbiont of Galathealinum brachiosum]
MNNPNISIGRSQESVLATNKVLKNTYMLLSITLIFSAITAFIGMQMQIGQGVAMIATFGAIGILWFVLPRTANSAAGIPTIFAFTGLIGLGMAPMLNMYLAVNPSVVSTALGGTGVIFLGLSGYALTTRKDFSFMGGFLMVGMLVVIVAALANIFLQMPVMGLVVSGAIVMLMSGLILYETSSIIHGGETNYIMATASLFLSIINLFQALLHLLSAFGGDD